MYNSSKVTYKTVKGAPPIKYDEDDFDIELSFLTRGKKESLWIINDPNDYTLNIPSIGKPETADFQDTLAPLEDGYSKEPTQTNKGKTMSENINVSVKSEAEAQRDFLLEQLQAYKGRYSSAPSHIMEELKKIFNIDAPVWPRDPRELVELIKKDKFKLDDKKLAVIDARKEAEAAEDYDADVDGIFWNYNIEDLISFEGYPSSDFVGYQNALTEWRHAYEKTRREIMILSPKEGLESFDKLRAWKYKPSR